MLSLKSVNKVIKKALDNLTDSEVDAFAEGLGVTADFSVSDRLDVENKISSLLKDLCISKTEPDFEIDPDKVVPIHKKDFRLLAEDDVTIIAEVLGIKTNTLSTIQLIKAIFSSKKFMFIKNWTVNKKRIVTRKGIEGINLDSWLSAESIYDQDQPK